MHLGRVLVHVLGHVARPMSITPTTPEQRYDFINYDSSANILKWATNNKSDFGVFTIKISASIKGVLY